MLCHSVIFTSTVKAAEMSEFQNCFFSLTVLAFIDGCVVVATEYVEWSNFPEDYISWISTLSAKYNLRDITRHSLSTKSDFCPKYKIVIFEIIFASKTKKNSGKKVENNDI